MAGARFIPPAPTISITLRGIDVDVRVGEVVAIVGGSGAGKTTLLETALGIRPPTAGVVEVDGVACTGAGPEAMGVGYVPQDDIVHRDLPLRRTIRHAAALRLGAHADATERDRVVDEVLGRLGLTDRADVRVGDLSGGQRKRASVAVELLRRPPILFLDEPTSGLDPAASADLLGQLHHLAAEGTAVVLTTHAVADIDGCDRVIFLARDGHLAFVGPPDDARRHFGVDDIVDVYRSLDVGDPATWAARWSAVAAEQPVADPEEPSTRPALPRSRVETTRRGPSALRQWWALSRRSADQLRHDRLTLAVLLGSPAAVTVMMAAMFEAGALEPGSAGVQSAVQTVYWLAFAAFFFGLTYGLLQVVVELPIVRRDRMAGVSMGAYIASKVAVLAPLLALVSAAMLVVLRALDRLPSASWETWLQLELTLWLTALAALTLGLLASAAVADATQATLALPMLCFPQVLFAGALVPASAMADVGRWSSHALVDRWSFESLGRILDLEGLVGAELAAAGYGDALSGSPIEGWAAMSVLALAGAAAAVVVLRRRTSVGRRRHA